MPQVRSNWRGRNASAMCNCVAAHLLWRRRWRLWLGGWSTWNNFAIQVWLHHLFFLLVVFFFVGFSIVNKTNEVKSWKVLATESNLHIFCCHCYTTRLIGILIIKQVVAQLTYLKSRSKKVFISFCFDWISWNLVSWPNVELNFCCHKTFNKCLQDGLLNKQLNHCTEKLAITVQLIRRF